MKPKRDAESVLRMFIATIKTTIKHRLQQIPERVYATASSHQLGTPLKAYKRLLYVVMMYILLAFLPVFILLLALYIHTTLDELAHLQSMNVVFDGKVDHELRAWISLNQHFRTQEMWGEIAIIALSTVVCAISCYIFYILQKQRLYVCSDGMLVYQGPRVKKYRAVRWDEVKELGVGNQFSLTDESKFVLTLPFTSSMKKEIDETITSHVVPLLLREVLNQYESGQPVTFGWLQIDQEGIAIPFKHQSIAWTDLGDARYEGEKLFIKVAGRWKQWNGGVGSYSMGTNLPVFVALVKQVIGVSG